MRPSPIVLIASVLAILSADPAMAQGRRKDDSHRVAPRREQTTTTTRDRRRDDNRETAGRAPMRTTTTRPRRDDDRERRRIIAPITVLSPRFDRDVYHRGYDVHGRRRVWNRERGMSCLQLQDELEWAHDEWHYRNDRHRGASWYDVEHARLEWRIADERAYSGCGRPYEDRECRERGRYPRTGSTLGIAVMVLDILLGGDSHDRSRW